MITLGIETSCDETAVGVVKNGQVLANVVSSQVAHTKYGGVVPELAARNHIRVIVPLVKLALEIAGKKMTEIELVCATRGPGLLGSLLVGLSCAKAMAISLKVPFVGVNHLEGHIYTLNAGGTDLMYPFLVLLVSGGHTELIMVKKEFKYTTVGKTTDHACGEAFDKVAKIVGLPYPGGPYVEKSALQGAVGAIRFPVPRARRFDFSYAGLKTAVLYYVRQHKSYRVEDVAANFQEAALGHLIEVTGRALRSLKVRNAGLVGGVSANKVLQEKLRSLGNEAGTAIHVPDRQYCTDNGAMIALAGARRFNRFGPSDISVDAVAREDLEEIPREIKS